MKKKPNDFPNKVTQWVGSTASLIVHSVFFLGIFVLRLFGFSASDVLLILTTLVSLEAIYLSIFIQISINKHSEELEEVSEDIEEIQKDVEGISEDVEDIQKDVEEISEDVEGIEKDVGELQEDVEEISEEEEVDKDSKFEYIEHTLESLLKEITELKKVTKDREDSRKTKS